MQNKIEDQEEGLTVKRPYRRPELHVFGKVLHLTQGSGGHHHDASGYHKAAAVRVIASAWLGLIDYMAASGDANAGDAQ